MASQNSNGQSAASAGSNATSHSLMSLLPNGANIHHLAAAAAAAAASHQQAANGGAGPISPTALHHPHHPSQSAAASAGSSNGLSAGNHHPTIKMETDLDELKPTDLSTNDRKYYGVGSNGTDCYP